MIKTVADDIANLIKCILSLAHLDSTNIYLNNFQEILLNDCVKKAIQLSEHLGKQKNIYFELNFLQRSSLNV